MKASYLLNLIYNDIDYNYQVRKLNSYLSKFSEEDRVDALFDWLESKYFSDEDIMKILNLYDSMYGTKYFSLYFESPEEDEEVEDEREEDEDERGEEDTEDEEVEDEREEDEEKSGEDK